MRTFVVPAVDDTDAMIEQVDHAKLRIPGYQPGDTVVIITRSPPNQSGSTDLIRVHRLSQENEPRDGPAEPAP